MTRKLAITKKSVDFVANNRYVLENSMFVKYKKHTVDRAAVRLKMHVKIIDLMFSGNL